MFRKYHARLTHGYMDGGANICEGFNRKQLLKASSAETRVSHESRILVSINWVCYVVSDLEVRMQLVIPLNKMSATDKMEAIEKIWEDLSSNASDVPSPAWHADVLRERESRIAEGSSRFLNMAEAKRAVWARIK